MTYREVLENARKTILNCKACPECNGLGCGNTLPGPGSKAPGNGAHDNWSAWKRIRLNFDTFVEDGPVDTGCELFGRRFSLPLMSGPIGSMTQYSKEDVTVPFNDGVMEGTARTGTIDCFGDGVVPETLIGALESMKKHHPAAIPVFNPMPNASIMKKMDLFEESDALAMCVVVDSAGLSHWKHIGDQPGTKTITDLKELKAHTNKPFLVKGIMTAKGALQAVEAGADGIIVSNHGGRALADVPGTAEVLPEIVKAVNKETKIIVDGGIRHGVDMVKAIALGADGVLICRPFAVAWFGGGAEGVKTYIELLKNEFSEAMYMVGARKITDLNPEMVRL
ncbi:MAG: alpha-hydroxy-acid oxidizing protein [Oscillospiraceae bacterium]|nr:alpha-hydroxy-acid oxidizing protein [Oscillospiraceae bacterium]